MAVENNAQESFKEKRTSPKKKFFIPALCILGGGLMMASGHVEGLAVMCGGMALAMT